MNKKKQQYDDDDDFKVGKPVGVKEDNSVAIAIVKGLSSHACQIRYIDPSMAHHTDCPWERILILTPLTSTLQQPALALWNMEFSGGSSQWIPIYHPCQVINGNESVITVQFEALEHTVKLPAIVTFGKHSLPAVVLPHAIGRDASGSHHPFVTKALAAKWASMNGDASPYVVNYPEVPINLDPKEVLPLIEQVSPSEPGPFEFRSALGKSFLWDEPRSITQRITAAPYVLNWHG